MSKSDSVFKPEISKKGTKAKVSHLYESLGEFSKKSLPMHMPGHKRNFALAPYIEELGGRYDLTELSKTDDLYNADGILQRSMDRASRLYGVKNSFYLVNGSSCGILSAVFACISRGDRVLVARNSHISVWHALMLRGARVSVLDCEYEKGICLGISARELEQSLEKDNSFRLLILTSPSYEGVISDIGSISKICKKHNIRLLVDAAHGAHFGLFGYHEHAVSLGADIEVKSLHKTLPSLGSTALLQSNDDELFERAKGYVRVFQTSSPSYVLMTSIDECVHLLEQKGEYLYERFCGMLSFFERSTLGLKNIELFEPKTLGFSKDKSRLCLLSPEIGAWLNEELEKSGIYIEMHNRNYCLALTGLTERKKSLCALIEALLRADRLILDRKAVENKAIENKAPKYPKLNEADYSSLDFETEIVSLEKAEGRILAENIYAYPPGIAYLTAGQCLENQAYQGLFKNDELHYSLTESKKGFINVYKM